MHGTKVEAGAEVHQHHNLLTEFYVLPGSHSH